MQTTPRNRADDPHAAPHYPDVEHPYSDKGLWGLLLFFPILNSCMLFDRANEVGEDLINRSSEEVNSTIKKVDTMVDQKIAALEGTAERLSNEVADRVDESVAKATDQIGDILREVLDADIIAFGAVGTVFLLLVWVIAWVIIQWRVARIGKYAKALVQDTTTSQPIDHQERP